MRECGITEGKKGFIDLESLGNILQCPFKTPFFLSFHDSALSCGLLGHFLIISFISVFTSPWVLNIDSV